MNLLHHSVRGAGWKNQFRSFNFNETPQPLWKFLSPPLSRPIIQEISMGETDDSDII